MRTVQDVINRLRGEFLEMPCLRLTAEQVQRLCGVEPTICQLVLDTLVHERFLCLARDGHYARVTSGLHAKAHTNTRANRRLDATVSSESGSVHVNTG